MRYRISSLAWLYCGMMAIVLAAGGASAASLPTLVDGYRIGVYAQLEQPEKLSFSHDGSLYVGSSNGTDRIRRIGPGGHPVVQFGPPQLDPDAVLADDDGRISGHRHAVLVGGGDTLAAISGFSIGQQTATGMVFGPDHALYLSDYDGNRILRISRGRGTEH